MLDRPEESPGKFNTCTQETGPRVFCTLCYTRQQRRKMNHNREKTAKSRTQGVAMPISGKHASGQELVRAVCHGDAGSFI